MKMNDGLNKSELGYSEGRLPLISAFGVSCVLLFLLFSLFRQFLIPFGDEPDFMVKAPELIKQEHFWWSPYYYLKDILSNINYISDCKVDSGSMTIWSSIGSRSCNQGLEQGLLRYFLTIIVTVPLLFAVIFRRWFAVLLKVVWLKKKTDNWTHQLDALSLALISPGLVYYLSVLSPEQFVFVLSLFVFLVWDWFVAVIMIVLLITAQDIGNGVVVVFFVVFAKVATWSCQKFGISFTLKTILAIILTSYFLNFRHLQILAYIPFLAAKVEAIQYVISTGIFVDEYPKIFRPILTFMSFNVFTPQFIKVIPLYLLMIGGVVLALFRLRFFYRFGRKDIHKQLFQIFNSDLVRTLSGITVVLSLTFILPNYSNAKYYIFLMPFFISLMLWVFNKKTFQVFLIFAHIILYTALLLFRL